ncbi:hypothetical protein [Natronobacterium gregoryi]|uniref:Uncharacterized protein n=2 Tax=Natronobacterium gregoryi TaxID=44930 RepID=L0AEN4_NATGS|nr:hypothetical protein [Natronobacterium gregoryi]AFZ71894.1 hypothetical protein Natgr_0646 [Natronobacterium gregoryi SP2]ELY62485.1 hypothetical protein C490_18023 [Natronobacterium gregoryi SP2]PLK20679.1 hypothetical protein CYV19_07935 [Natronobacterium gregoryi SP2]SFJ14626.1 hypothetical protein SAMN05443661_11575 [Natronobacterium gregoryi]
MTNSDDGVPSLALLDALADRILEYAAAELEPERTTLEVMGYADGDYEIRAYETRSIQPDADGGEIWERVAIRYNRQIEWIQLHHYRESDDGRTTREVRDLESYPDPVALAGDDE